MSEIIRYERLTPSTVSGFPPYKISTVRGITIHNTNTIDVGKNYKSQSDQYAAAQAAGNLNGVFVHYYVDEISITKALLDTQCGYHAGDTAKGRRIVNSISDVNGNFDTLSIEIIGGSDVATANGIELAAELMRKCSLDISRLFKHQDWNGKYCPAYILEKNKWDFFKTQVKLKLETVEKSVMYRVQVGAFKEKKNAQNLLERLKNDGYDAYIT